jgi:DNA-binding NarL/FixJ family response regulator
VSGPIRVLVVDDHPTFRDGVASVLDRAEGLELVGEAGSGEDAVRQSRQLRPDVVLMDLAMPGIGGVEATRRITRELPDTAVVAVTMADDDRSLAAALDAGATGYVLKDAGRGSLVRAVRGAVSGETVLPRGLARQVLRHAGPTVDPAAAAAVASLTAREREILTLMARGQRNPDIAVALFISERTVGNHISNIFAKLGVTDRVGAASLAWAAGLAAR